MKIPVLTAIIIIFVLWLFYEIKKSKKNFKEDNENFWKRENDANLARRTDISDLNYITLPLDHLPMSNQEDSTINSYRDTILKLSDKKMLNLSGYSNTDLKFKYGAANFNILSDCDNNYSLLVSTLEKWGERLYSKGLLSEAIQVLEFAVSCNSDVSRTYQLLARIYIEQNTPEKINTLLDKLHDINMFHKDIIIEELKNSQLGK